MQGVVLIDGVGGCAYAKVLQRSQQPRRRQGLCAASKVPRAHSVGTAAMIAISPRAMNSKTSQLQARELIRIQQLHYWPTSGSSDKANLQDAFISLLPIGSFATD